MIFEERGIRSVHDIENHAIHLLGEYRAVDAYISSYKRAQEMLFDFNAQLECDRIISRAEFIKEEIGRALALVQVHSKEEYSLLWHRYVHDTPVKELLDILSRNGRPLTRRAYELLRNRAMSNFLRICRVELLEPIEEEGVYKKKRGRKSIRDI